MSENLLLAALGADERARLDPFLELVPMRFGEVLIEAEEPITHCYFPIDAITSTIQTLEDGTMIETGLMGIEGFIGIQLWLRVPSTSTRTLVQVEGTGRRMRSGDFAREVMNRPESPLNDLAAKYIHAFLAMTGVVAACNRIHPIDQRMCRWLMLIYNRRQDPSFRITQDFLSMMLGTSRPTVSTTANMLKSAGLIDYVRGQMEILDTEGLKNGSCECLEVIESQFDKIFDAPWLQLAKQEKKYSDEYDRANGRERTGRFG